MYMQHVSVLPELSQGAIITSAKLRMRHVFYGGYARKDSMNDS